MRVAIRVDASQAIGTGHVRRSLALAQELRRAGAELLFVTRELGVQTPAMIREAGFVAVTLPAPVAPMAPSRASHAVWAEVGAAQDVRETVLALGEWNPDWLVLDHYAFDACWHEAVRVELGCRIVVIDDLADRALAADLVVDHNYAVDHCAKYAGRLATGTKLLGGPRYALLGPAFADAPRHAPHETVASIGIFMGGVDRDNISMVVLDAITLAGFDGSVEIASTSANLNLAALREAAAGRPGTLVITDLPDLTAFFARHDVQVGAGGGATWERCCIGAPTLLLVVAQNQLAVVPALVEDGVVVSPEPLGTLAPEAIAAALRPLLTDMSIRTAMSQRARSLVDGLGARRVALRMLATSVSVRPATRGDAERMYRWRNHPATRAVSRSTDEIAWQEHVEWLDWVLADTNRTLMIGTVGDLPIGVVRLDRLEDDRAEVSLYIDPALHGLGLGRAMLLAAEAAIADRLDILAEVMEENEGSARMFESAGYARVDATHWIKPAIGKHAGELAR